MTRGPHSKTSATFPAASDRPILSLIEKHLCRLLAADPAVGHDDHVVRGGGEIEVMGYDDHGATIVMCEVRQDPLHVAAGGGVEVAGRFVGQDQQRIVGECLGDGDPLALPARKLPRQLLGFARQTEAVEQFRRALFDLTLRQPAEPLHRQHDVLRIHSAISYITPQQAEAKYA
jgi:hypothetical protein